MKHFLMIAAAVVVGILVFNMAVTPLIAKLQKGA